MTSSRAFALLVVLTLPLAARAARSPSGLWEDRAEKPLLAARGVRMTPNAARNGIVPSSYRTLTLDRAALKAALAGAPYESDVQAARAAGAPEDELPPSVEIELPIPNSTEFARFAVRESPIMDDGISARYPEIRTYLAQGIDNTALTARLDLTPAGFHAMIFSPTGQIFIDPYFVNGSDLSTSIAFYKRDCPQMAPFSCGVAEVAPITPDLLARASTNALARPTGASLRTYRLAVATTGEYATAAGGGTLAGTLAAVVTTVNRVSAVYERDFSIRLKLIDGEDKIIYLNSTTDPYTNSNASSLLTQNQTTLDSIIGTANYDIGHVFSTGGGGLAGLGVVCRAGNKARGETGSSNPVGDPYDIDYVAHEMGHQFGGNHTFNSAAGNCGGGNRSAGAAYEVGSGITIMAYAGICSPQDLAPNSDDYFHTKSYDEIDAYTTTGAGTCATSTPTGNSPPVITTPATFTIPANTPFALTASATDADGERMTYCWEEFDLGAAQATTGNVTDLGSGPIFRSYAPAYNPTRFFPSLTYILNNANVPPATIPSTTFITGEVMPSTTRTLNFRCTVRDNHPGGGGSNFGTTQVLTTNAAGPFSVTAPNSAATYAGGSPLTVTWNVANTTVAPVNCASVKISLSTDGGLTYPIVLADAAPNAGSAAVTLPNTGNVATTQGRIKVEAVGNIFFDVSNANFTVTSTNTAPTISGAGSLTVRRGTPTASVGNVGTVTAGSNPLASASVSGLPEGANVTAAIVGSAIQLTATADCRLTTTLSSRTYPISVTVTDTAGSTASATVNLLIQPNLAPTLGAYPAGNTVLVGTIGSFAPATVPADGNGNLLPAPMSLSTGTPFPGGILLVDQSTGAVQVVAPTASTPGTYTVHVTAQDSCGAATTQDLTFTVSSSNLQFGPTFAVGALPLAATVGSAYTYTVPVAGTPAPVFFVTSGTLPPGLSLDPNTGVISGTPTASGIYPSVQITANNSAGVNAQLFTFTVNNAFASYVAASGLTGADAAATADPNGNGLTNLAEYGFNLNPAVAASGTAPLANIQVANFGGASYLTATFTRVPLATDLTYQVQVTSDFVNWTTVARSVHGAALAGPGLVSDSGGTVPHTVQARDTVPVDATAPRRFMRVRVTTP